MIAFPGVGVKKYYRKNIHVTWGQTYHIVKEYASKNDRNTAKFLLSLFLFKSSCKVFFVRESKDLDCPKAFLPPRTWELSKVPASYTHIEYMRILYIGGSLVNYSSTYIQREKTPILKLTIEGISHLLLRLMWLEYSSLSFSISGLVLSITQSFLAISLTSKAQNRWKTTLELH